MYALQFSTPEIIQKILERNPNIDVKDNDGWTPLMLALRFSTPEIIQMILERNPNIDIQNNDDWTHLMFALRYSTPEIIQKILERNTNIDTQHNNGWTPLMLALQYSTPKIIKLILERDPNINIKNNEGETALDISKKVVFKTDGEKEEIINLIKSKIKFLTLNDIQTCNVTNLQQIQKVFSKLTDKITLGMSHDETCNVVKTYLEELKRGQLETLPQCKTNTTLLGSDIKDIHPLFFYVIKENDNLFCGDIRELVKLDKNPWTNKPLNNTIIKEMRTNLNKLNGIEIEDIEEEITETITTTIRKAMNQVLEVLRYPKSVEGYVTSNNTILNNFIERCFDENILSLSEKRQIINIPNLDSRKLLLAQVLKMKLTNDTTININGINIGAVSVMLEEIYNSIF
jgi:hypothetical protein